MIAGFTTDFEPVERNDVRVRLEPGVIHRFKGIAGKPNDDGSLHWDYAPCDCFLIALSRNVECGQETVVYTPLNGCYASEVFNCTLRFWAEHFEQPPPEKEPERIPWDQVHGKVLNLKEGHGF